MNTKKKIIASLLLVSMLLPAYTSCSESENSKEDTNSSTETAQTASDTASESETEAETTYFDDMLPAADYSGKTFTILHRPAASAHDTMPYFNHEEMTGEPVDDAIFTQVTSVEEKYGIDIVEALANDVPSTVTQSAAAGDNAYNTIIHSNIELANLVTQNALLDLNQLEEINFDMPWWNSNYKEKLTINGKTYLAFGDLFFQAAINNVHLMYFNKDMCDEFNLEYPYEAVYNGTWTLDYITKMVDSVYMDLDGNGEKDENDRWGLVQSPIQSSIIFYTSGFRVMDYDDEGYPYLNMYSEEFVNFYEALYNFDFNTPGIWTNSQAQEDSNFDMFVEGNVLISSHFLTVVPTLREVEFEVGILPYPKYTEESEYINWPTGGNFLLAVPSVTSYDDYDFTGTILEALACQGHSLVRPALYETTLQGKLARDPESRDMLDIIFDTMSIDFGWIHNGNNGMGWFVNTCLNSKFKNISSIYAKLAPKAEKYYAEIVDYYKKLD
ncbi:MAG: hypothetical protein ACI4XJ_11325 [Eubacteriales bacterium]